MKETKRKKSLKEKGITLIAIVVTIVILLILAGVTINMTLGSNGLFIRAQESRAQYENSTANEVEQMNSITGILDGMIDNNGGGETTTTPPSEGSYTNVDTTKTNPVAVTPTGSTVIEADANKGIVIKDTNQNEWVWIEVPKTIFTTATSNTDYTKIEADLKTYTATYKSSVYKDAYYSDKITGLTKEQYDTLYQKMLKSVYTNGGFWIGRYEAGDAVSAKRTYASGIANPAVSRANVIPYNYVTCAKAQTLASQMAPSGYTSSLMFGVQWDLVLRYLEAKGVTQEELKTNSTTWGNYNNANFTITNTSAKYSTDYGSSWNPITSSYSKPTDSVLLTTGANASRNSKMNICDLAGNVYEWTLEYTFYVYPCCSRGGYYDNGGSNYPAASRFNFYTTEAPYNVGFRSTLL